MSHLPSLAERLDRALDDVLGGQPAAAATAAAGLDATARPLVALGGDIHAAMPSPPIAARFEARLGARLADAAHPRAPLAWARRNPGRLIVTGAVGSAAVGVGLTALAVWRSGRRASAPAHRLLHR